MGTIKYLSNLLGTVKFGRDADNLLDFTTDNEITFRVSGGDNVVFRASGEIAAKSLDIGTGGADINGTLEANAITIGGVTLAETIADTVGAMVTSNTETDIDVTYDDADNTLDFVVGNISGSAGLATNITASANNSTNETVYPTFVDGATGSQGIETDTGLTYNPSSGVLTATNFTGALTGQAATVATIAGLAPNTATTQATQGAITSLGTLTTLTVDNVIINGATIGHTSDTDLMTMADGILTIAGDIAAVDLDISGNVDVDGTLEADAITVDGATLANFVKTSVGEMLDGNTTTGITATFQGGDKTIDLVVGTLNQDTTGTAADATVLETSRDFRTNLASTSSAGFTGAADCTPGVTGTLAVGNGGTGLTSVSTLLNSNVTSVSGNAGTATVATSVTASANNSTNETCYLAFVDGATGTQGIETDTDLTYNPDGDLLTVRGISCDQLSGDVVGDLEGNADTATTAQEATNVTATANNSANETVYPVFVDGVSGAQGIETDSGLTYNPSTGVMTGTRWTGAVTGDVTGNASGTAATVTTAAQTNITSVGTLTALTVSGVLDLTGTTDSSDATGDTGILKCEGGASIAKKIYAGGTITGSADVIAYSDKKLKENIKTLDGKKVLEMRGVSFDRIDTGKASSGVIAQELEKIAPELVIDDGNYKGVAYGNLVGYLIEAVKDQQKQINELKEIIDGSSRYK